MVTKTNADGAFAFKNLTPGIYHLRVEKAGWQDGVAESLVLSEGDQKHFNLLLEPVGPAKSQSSSTSSSSSAEAVEFDDKPNFRVVGVTDWNGGGGHGSDVILRTSEALAKETATYKSGKIDEKSGAPKDEVAGHAISTSESEQRAALIQAPESFEANHRLGEFYFLSRRYSEAIPLLEAAFRIDPANYNNAYDLALAYQDNGEFALAREQIRKMLTNTNSAELHRLLGDLDEQSGDPLEAVREYEQATRLDPSEQDYFNWGTELLLHRAIPPALEVLSKGASRYPKSSRMLAGLGAALYASGSYGEAARRLCEASDLRPADQSPYIFLGQMENATPGQLPCVEEKLARFEREQPENAFAHYYYAMALAKRQRGSETPASVHQTEVLLEKAINDDPALGGAYLQLGILYSSEGKAEQAISAYKKAIETDPNLGEAHYRLAQAFQRSGEQTQTKQEFQIYEQIQKTEAGAIERQRREIQQFMIVFKDQPAAAH
jgi:tetratricopeptide (TPR) repeat protein